MFSPNHDDIMFSPNHDDIMFSPNHDDLAHLKIPLKNIQSATNNFDYENSVGEDDFGSHYIGQLLLSGEFIDIHVRRWLNKDRDDKILFRDFVEQQFWTEISMLSSLKHKNLVSLVGFCDENDELITVFNRETRGILNNYLSDPMLLTWVRRLKICVALAHALSYIHYDESRNFSVIHQNIYSKTVLLNDNLEPKLSEFGLSIKIKASERHLSFNISNVSNRQGYTDPTYIETKSAHHKSDIYSFGILMFELLCGRKEVIDSNQDNSLFAEIAYKCLEEERSRRPNIDDIVAGLEKDLELACENRPILVSKKRQSKHVSLAECQFISRKRFAVHP
ncbi:kinase-like domain-containing protein [Tanacetum coccineum]|uniref:Kinase-like domain-containing protein n=1 Tax=Tanacetum coccineum TaxID=301880 RepID=A0ABQ5B329_9ASTR